MKKILITGINGQDGTLLSKIFLKKKYKVYGFIIKKNKLKKVNCFNIKNRNMNYIISKIDDIKPDVIIHLGSNNPRTIKYLIKTIIYLI